MFATREGGPAGRPPSDGTGWAPTPRSDTGVHTMILFHSIFIVLMILNELYALDNAPYSCIKKNTSTKMNTCIISCCRNWQPCELNACLDHVLFSFSKVLRGLSLFSPSHQSPGPWSYPSSLSCVSSLGRLAPSPSSYKSCSSIKSI